MSGSAARARRPVRTALAFLAVLAAGFAWGFLAQREKIFPHLLLRRIAVRLGISIWRQPMELRSTTPRWEMAASVPYLDTQIDPHPETSGVVLNREERAAPGWNFYSVPGRRAAYLIDSRGKLLWRWNLSAYRDIEKVGPDEDVGFTHLYPNGDALAYLGRHVLVKIDRHSRILWEYDAEVHHDAWVDSDGTIYALIKRQRFDRTIHPEGVVLEDVIVVLSPEGAPRREIPLLRVLENSPYAFLLPKPPQDRMYDDIGLDVLHTNHVEVYDGALERLSPLFRKGNILVSFKDLCAIAILDGRTSRILWLWGPTNLALQHHPTILPDGDILLFDNGTEHSRVIEVDPRTDSIVWRYDPEGEFFSTIRGSCQRLPNGDTLIGVSQAGFAVEVTKEKEPVWKFVNPDVGPDHARQAIFRITRFDPRQLDFVGKGGMVAGADGP
ncbi:MAG TPA: aryl-sulfate sulfotransferase [Thermoanaerobaculia bacterium]|nr:aryl-sulfate sulfotransferase [Thermoanaerobaculia bacterium]